MMGICQDHWGRLREKIAEAGLGSLVSESGEEAARIMVQSLQGNKETVDNFDPMLNAYFNILNHGAEYVEQAGGSPLYIMFDGPEDPIDVTHYPGYAAELLGKTWPRCAICYLNLVHKITCKEMGCTLDKETGFDFMLDKATEAEVERWKRLND